MKRTLLVLSLLIGIAAVSIVWRNYRDEDAHPSPAATLSQEESIARGAYLARAGHCAGCHTARGGTPYAGGHAIPTPFGTLYAPNLTPDPETGIGAWTSDDFWRALHNGRAKDGRFLYPACPYPNYTKVTRADTDALYAYLRSLPPVRQPNRPHELRFPYSTQLALAVWRALYFEPGVYEPDETRSAEWNRGAYLVNGLGHCSACHARRNALGATDSTLSGGTIPVQGWYAPSLHSKREASVAGWPREDIVALLKHGISPQASALGPMAAVVHGSTQHLSDADLRAMALYLSELPVHEDKAPEPPAVPPARLARGERVYAERCADCHGEQGEGVPGMYPPLAGNRAILLEPPVNTIRAVLNGGFPPATAGNPQPFGMPPYATLLSDEDVAAVVSYIRNAWGNRASPVNAWEVATEGRGIGVR